MSNIFSGGAGGGGGRGGGVTTWFPENILWTWAAVIFISSLGQLTRIEGLWEDINPTRTVSPVVSAILP